MSIPLSKVSDSPYLAPSAAPGNLSVYANDSTELNVNWSPPPLDQQNGMIRLYQVKVVDLQTGQQLQYTTSSILFTVTELHPFYNYEVSVSAVTNEPGPFSEAVLGTTLPDSKRLCIVYLVIAHTKPCIRFFLTSQL